jgi:hypothetical protein
VVTLLLQHGADVSIINAEGSTAKSLAKTPEIQRLIQGMYLKKTVHHINMRKSNTWYFSNHILQYVCQN